MIEDVKWLKPDDYSRLKMSSICWIAKDGNVMAGYFDRYDNEVGFHYFGDGIPSISVIPYGVCERKPNQKKPVLR